MLRTIGALRRGASGGADAALTIPSLPISPSSPCHSRAALAFVALSRSLASLHSPPISPQIPLPQLPQSPTPTVASPSQQQQRSLHSRIFPRPAFIPAPCLPHPPLRAASRAPFSSAADSAPPDSSSPDPPPSASHPPSAPNSTKTPAPPTERVGKLADQILGLTLLEMSELTAVIRKRLGMPANAGMGGMPMGMMMMPGGAAPGGGGGGEAAPAAAVEEKTAFDVKLEGFDAAAKLKVIKEVRSIAGLGLKEAKEFVEKAPVVVKAGVSKEDAAAIAEKLKAVGATVAVDAGDVRKDDAG
ncbi:unnamed protein product [Closterium sp. NIES-65]|nr:unnamed protein product [Closterium sp. NIES-65]